MQRDKRSSGPRPRPLLEDAESAGRSEWGRRAARCACSQGSAREKRLNLSPRDFRVERNGRSQLRKQRGGRLLFNLLPWRSASALAWWTDEPAGELLCARASFQFSTRLEIDLGVFWHQWAGGAIAPALAPPFTEVFPRPPEIVDGFFLLHISSSLPVFNPFAVAHPSPHSVMYARAPRVLRLAEAGSTEDHVGPGSYQVPFLKQQATGKV